MNLLHRKQQQPASEKKGAKVMINITQVMKLNRLLVIGIFSYIALFPNVLKAASEIVDGISIDIKYVEATGYGSTFMYWDVINKTGNDIDYSVDFFAVIKGEQYKGSRFGHSLGQATSKALFSIDIDNVDYLLHAGKIRFVVKFHDRTRNIKGKLDFHINSSDLRTLLRPPKNRK